MTEKEYISLLQKQYFLSNLTEFLYIGLVAYIPKIHNITENYLDYVKFRDFYFNKSNTENKLIMSYLTGGKNISSNEDILFFEELLIEYSIFLYKDIFLFLNVNDLDIKFDYNNNIIKAKFNSKLLFNEKKEKKICPATFEFLSPMNNISIDVIKDNESFNLTITSINENGFSIIPHYDFFIIFPCLEYGILFSFNENTIQNYLNDLDYIYKPDYFPPIYKCNAYNVTLIFFSIINAIYIQKFILSIKK